MGPQGWAIEPNPSDSLDTTAHRMTFRVMGPHEQGRFAPEAWGRLLQLKGSGALSAPELEQVIERALTHIDGRIALDDLRLLLEGVGVIDDTDGPGADRVH
ncbi:MAG TPA: DUF494 family protein [Gemmatimonadaceae bacterium]|nr:DUF494 family protein [Gemmatimonadaceae bacterium]